MPATERTSRERLRMASNFRTILNDLKRRPEDAARDLGVAREQIDRCLSGDLAIPMDLVEKAVAVWPVSPRDFFLLEDDCPTGVKIMRSAASEASARVMARGGNDYYEYRDTAMSSVAAFRPEWILELCVVEDNDPENPKVQWNNGHFLHQFTYFVGPVNFYYRDVDGSKKVALMNTGDSMYISPFVPHTFTTRANANGDVGLILALTYANRLGGETQQELGLLGREEAEHLVIQFDSPRVASGSLINFHRETLSMPLEQLAENLGESPESLRAIENGQLDVDIDLLTEIAQELNVSPRELLAGGAGEATTRIKTHDNCRNWTIPHDAQIPVYRVVELCGSEKLPFSRALEFSVSAGSREDPCWLQVGLHQYAFNLGDSNVTILWWSADQLFEESIQPGDSFYMKPGTRHAFLGEGGKLLILRIAGRLGGDVLQELATIGPEHLDRVLAESKQWFDPKGRQDVSN